MKIKKGDLVDYHSVIGGPITSTRHRVTCVEPMPNAYGRPVAWITGRSGCVALSALTRSETESSLQETTFVLAPYVPRGARAICGIPGFRGQAFVPLFVAGDVHGDAWATYFRRSTGAMERLRRAALPIRPLRTTAEQDLRRFAMERRFFLVRQTPTTAHCLVCKTAIPVGQLLCDACEARRSQPKGLPLCHLSGNKLVCAEAGS